MFSSLPLVGDRYRVLASLGVGASSVVLEAEDTVDGGRRALKVFRRDDPLFQQEFSLLSRLDHPHVVGVHALGRLNSALVLPDQTLPKGASYLVLDRVAGEPADEVFARLPLDERGPFLLRLARELAAALEHLHGYGLMHHDVKPANVLVDGEGRAVLVDFGLASQLGDEGARGTPAFMAPEALAGLAEPRSDLYALGATLHAIIRGQVPFAGQGGALFRAIIESPPPMLDSSELDPPFAQLVARLMHKEPARRPATARQLQVELLRLEGAHARALELARTPALAPPPFVGQGTARKALSAALAGAGGVVWVRGGPGSGKGRVVAEALRQRQLAFAAGRGAPLQIVRDLPATEAPAEDPVTVAAAMLASLHRRARGQALVLLLEQPAAGSAAWALIEAIAATRPANIFVLLESRAAEPPNLACELIDVAPLGQHEIALLAEGMADRRPSEDELSEITRLSAGNAALVVELVRRWALGRGLVLAEGARLEALQAAQRAEESLPARELLDALALWRRPASLEQLATLSASDVGAVAKLLTTLAGRGLVVQQEGRWRFVSAAHGRAWAAAVEDRQRLALLRRARAVEQDTARRAEHAVSLLAASSRLGEAEEPAAIWPEVAAACRLLQRRGEVKRALDLCGGVRGLEPALAAEQRLLQAALHLGLADYAAAAALVRDESEGEGAWIRAEAARRQGDYDGAFAGFEALSRTSQQQELRARASLGMGRVLLRRGQAAAAVESCRAVAEGALGGEQTLSEAQAAALEVFGLGHFYGGDLARAEKIFAAGERSLATARPALRARFAAMSGMVAFSAGKLPRAAADYGRALAWAEEAADVHATATYRGNLGSAELERGHYGRALDALVGAEEQLARLGRTAELGALLCNVGDVMVQLGELDAAAGRARRAQELLGRAGSEHLAGYVHLLEGDIARRRGAPEEAARAYRAAVELFAAREAPRELLLARQGAIEVGSGWGGAQGGGEQALAAFDEALALDPHATSGPPEGVEDPILEEHWLLATGRLLRACRAEFSGAEEIIERLTHLCVALEEREAHATLWRAAALLGGILALRGHARLARRALQRARTIREKIMSEIPEAYKAGAKEDAEAQRLERVWKALSAPPGPGEGSGAETREGAGGSSFGSEYERQLRRLIAINKRLNSEHRVEPLLEMILDTVIELTDAERGFLIVVEDGQEEGEGRLSIHTARNIDRRSLEGEELELSRSIAERAARSGQPVVTVDAAEDARFSAARSVGTLHLRSVLATPLRIKGRVVGTIYVDHRLRRGAFGELDVELVQDFADQAAIALENARLLAENERRRSEIEGLNEKLSEQVEVQAAELSEVKEVLRGKEASTLRQALEGIVGAAGAMQELYRLIERVSETDLPVVIHGESGTGKELVARAIHQRGRRSKRPFVSENCGAIPETLLESVLFGAMRGAYTGATRDRKGLFEIADGGTLLLDEVSEMSTAMQTKLLRVLQEGEFRRVGGERAIRVDVRVLAATNRDLTEQVKAGAFREDLFYRLNVVAVAVPPLRERREDIPRLVEHFLTKHGAQGRRVLVPAMSRLMGYRWPGNVRELENEVMRLAALTDQAIGVEDLSPQIGSSEPLTISDGDDLFLRPRVEHLERQLIQRALERTGGNQSQAAKLLGVSRYGLLKKLKRFYPERYL